MTNTAAANGKEAAYHGVPAEDDYGYAQAIKIGNTIHVSGQLSHDDRGAMIAPAALDGSGKPADFSMMAEQMRVTYANAAKILARFGATLDHVVEETLYVLDVDEAFAVAEELDARDPSVVALERLQFLALLRVPHAQRQVGAPAGAEEPQAARQFDATRPSRPQREPLDTDCGRRKIASQALPELVMVRVPTGRIPGSPVSAPRGKPYVY